MTALRTDAEVSQLQAAYDRADAERAAFRRWEQAMGAYEVARDEATQAWRSYAEAVGE